MPAEDRAPKPGSGARRLPLFWVVWGIGSLVTVGFVLLLVLPGTAQASEGQQAEPSSSSKVSERPTWLRPLEDEAKPSGAHPWGWSQIEPGVLDVQAWDWLQQDLERILDETKAPTPNRLSPEAFEAKFLGATVEFLELDAAATKTFQTAVNRALDEIDGARADMRRRRAKVKPGLDETDAMLESRAGWEEYGKAQRHAVRHPLAVLQAQPRHQLLREKMLKWLLRLDYGKGSVLASVRALDPAISLGGPDQRGESWRDSESVAFADAHTSGRHVVVVFGAEWCLPCQKIEQIMNDDRVFGLLSESFVPLHLDITELSDHDEALQAKYHAPALPAVIFVDAAGRELGRHNREDLSAESFIAELRSIMASHPLASRVKPMIPMEVATSDEQPSAGTASSATTGSAVPSQRVAVMATAGRFEPAEVHLVQGVPAVLEFTRVVDSACMNAVRMPWMEKAVDLPMNEKVEISVDTSKTGTFAYSCWMNMVFGKVVIDKAD